MTEEKMNEKSLNRQSKSHNFTTFHCAGLLCILNSEITMTKLQSSSRHIRYIVMLNAYEREDRHVLWPFTKCWRKRCTHPIRGKTGNIPKLAPTAHTRNNSRNKFNKIKALSVFRTFIWSRMKQIIFDDTHKHTHNRTMAISNQSVVMKAQQRIDFPFNCKQEYVYVTVSSSWTMSIAH